MVLGDSIIYVVQMYMVVWGVWMDWRIRWVGWGSVDWMVCDVSRNWVLWLFRLSISVHYLAYVFQ